MRVFIAMDHSDDPKDLAEAVACIRKIPHHPKVYVLGELDKWSIVERHDLDGLISMPPVIKAILAKEEPSKKP